MEATVRWGIMLAMDKQSNYLSCFFFHADTIFLHPPSPSHYTHRCTFIYCWMKILFFVKIIMNTTNTIKWCTNWFIFISKFLWAWWKWNLVDARWQWHFAGQCDCANGDGGTGACIDFFNLATQITRPIEEVIVSWTRKR